MAEAMYYYSGLCSSPRLVYRTSTETTPWTMPTGPEAYRQLKELRPVFGHKLNVVWTTDLGPKVCRLLDFQGVLWTTIDVVRGWRGRSRRSPSYFGLVSLPSLFWARTPTPRQTAA
jgi:hypothetical protein